MLYIEDISALEFWLSPARVVLDGQKLARLSSLDDCPRNSRESSWHSLEDLPCDLEKPMLAIPGAQFRAQRERFKYHVWPREIPPGSFWQVTDEAAVASPALAIAQTARRFREEHIGQFICSLAGTYTPVKGRHSDMIDELAPLVAIDELRTMTVELKGIYNTRKLESALTYVAENSASPGETNLLLVCSMTKGKGGLYTRGWEMNVEMSVPFKFRRYLEQSTIKPDLYSREHGIVLEYDSDKCHGTLERQEKDAKRRIVLEAMGFKVMPVHTSHMRSAAAFEEIATWALERFGKRRCESTPQQLVARDKLLNSLRKNPLFA